MVWIAVTFGLLVFALMVWFLMASANSEREYTPPSTYTPPPVRTYTTYHTTERRENSLGLTREETTVGGAVIGGLATGSVEGAVIGGVLAYAFGDDL